MTTLMMFREFWEKQSQWSQETFGKDNGDGTGSLKHLLSEIEEVIRSPNDIMEYVDMVFLSFDAARREGSRHHTIALACHPINIAEMLKRKVNKILSELAVDKHKRPDAYQMMEIILLVFAAARHAGFEPAQLLEKCFEKLEINKRRKWKKNADGITVHVEGT